MTTFSLRRLTLRNQQHARPRRGGIAAVLAGVVALSALTLPAAGQLGGVLPEEIIKSTSLSADDKAKIETYVRDHAAGLAGDPAAIKQSRSRLASPLHTAEVGTSFRVAYADALLANDPKGPRLRDQLKNSNDQVAITAAYLLGETGAKASLDALLSVVTEKESRPSVRLTVMLGIGRTFDAVRTSGPAISKGDATRAITTLEAAFRAEMDADVADAITAAFDSASRVPEDKLAEVRNEAATRLAAAVQSRIKDPKADGFSRAWARAGGTMIAGVKNENAGTAFSKEVIVTAAGTAGDLLGWAVRRVTAGLPEGGAPDDLVQIAQEAETLWTFCNRKVGSTPSQTYNFDKSLSGTPGVGDKAGTPPNPDKFKADAEKLIGSGGKLTEAPFAYKAERFH